MTKTVYLSYDIPGEDRRFLEDVIKSLVAVRKTKTIQAMEDEITRIVNMAVASSLIKVQEEAAANAE
jgi:hypothetical protein